ncbi:hypothetical protein R69619_02724 [Paraburkholderia nemoris]|uniref:hypothetical protein n=1 Tax=Paraburkholderia nemoris TaxID=2793076 RepID=UPI00190E238B|nr:hypothetical protein [Paraburkholderia nemoris]MBK3741172.1 hypothetical protein [Paraburkholderia aspalathi]CAE6746541.1 hypothetical protein R69619_02724 [Paraburkholderia nemoris]
MPKITDATPGEPVVVDTRADSTVDVLQEIALEEMSEHADIAAKAEAAEQATIESEAADVAAGWREALGVAREMLIAVIPPLDPVWSNPRLDALSVALGRCDQAYGWGGAGKLLGHPLFGLVAAGAPIGYGTYQVVKPMMDKAKAEQAAKAAQAIKPGSMTQEQLAVAPGAPSFGS